MVIGLKYGQTESSDSEAKALSGKKTVEFLEAFKNHNKSIICRDLLECDISKDDNEKAAKEKGLFKTRCVKAIEDAVTILEDLKY